MFSVLQQKLIGPARPYLIFAVTAPVLLMAAIDSTVIAVGLPVITREMDTSLAWTAWTISGYLLAQTIAMPIAGKLSDELGRKRLFLSALVVFTLSSMAAGLAPNIYALIFFRVLEGLGGGIFLPSATGIISDAFGDRRATAIGLFTTIFPLGGIIGPNLGGVIIDHVSWRWIFFVNVPLGLALFLGGLLVLPSRPVSTRRGHIDFLGAALFVVAIFSVLYAITTLANHPDDIANPVVWTFFAMGLSMLALFLRHEDRVASPMIDLDLLRWRPFFAANAYNFIYGACVFGFTSFVPYYAHVAYNMTAGESGLLLTPRSAAMAITSIGASFLLLRGGYRLPMITGTLLIISSLLLTSRGFHDANFLGWQIPNLLLLSSLVGITGIGIGIAGPASSNAALDLIPEKVAAVAGLRGMFRSTGGVLGTATVTLVLSRFNDKALGMEYIFLFLALGLSLLLPLIFLIPDLAKQRQVAAARGSAAPSLEVPSSGRG
ncbi:MAG TPA: MFS transporter [Dehalococcoidia bacterium]|nr:MFS transporter [Dehalococcoidia bacterium]